MTSNTTQHVLVRGRKIPRYTTLLALVAWLHDGVESDEAVVETALSLIKSRRVVLTGNFAGCCVEESFPEAH